MKFELTLSVIGAAALAGAQTVSPKHLANTEGNSFFSFTVETGSSRTYQSLINANQLTDLVGKQIDGLSWRLDSSSPIWSTMSGTMSSFEIRIGQGVAPSAANMAFANNFLSTPTLVRSGALTINPGDFSAGGSPNNWGPNIKFDSSFLYTGGNLTVEYRFNALPLGMGQAKLDASFTGEQGFLTDYAAMWNIGNTETTSMFAAANNRAIVTKFNAAPVPEPATMAVLGVGAMALLRRRKARN